jgi:hypothetical protein
MKAHKHQRLMTSEKAHKRQRLMTPEQEQSNINIILRNLGFVCMLFPVLSLSNRNSPELYQRKRSNSF